MTFIVHTVELSEEENKVEINEFLLFLHLLFFKSTRFDLKKKATGIFKPRVKSLRREI